MDFLIFSVDYDLHANAVCWALNKAGIFSEIIDLKNFPSNQGFAINFCSKNDVEVNLSENWKKEKYINLNSVKLFWCRRMLQSASHFDFSDVHPEDLNNVIPEVRSFVEGFWYFSEFASSDNAVWVNSLDSMNRANSKALQLKIAHSVGLKIPNTLIGNDPESVRHFCKSQGGEIIVKSFYQQSWKKGEISVYKPTTLINMDHLHDDKPISLCPSIFQNKINKKFELRVVVMGEKMIAGRINSQEHKHAALDWRLDVYKKVVKIEPFFLDDTVQKKISKFMNKMGLRFGSIDLIVDENDEVIFLEINEQGNFLFLEKQCPEIPVLSSVCEFFSREAGLSVDVVFPKLIDYFESPEYQRWMKLKDVAMKSKSKRVNYAFEGLD